VTATVALDAMGGDDAPEVTVRGALAARESGIEVILVGDGPTLEARLAEAGAPSGVPVHHAAGIVTMHDDPIAALRREPDSSIRVACQLVADGQAGAVVSAGSTGATLAAALLTIGRLPGIRRPVVAAVLPVADGRQTVLADAGGSMDVQAEVLAGYAAMGAAYAAVLGSAEPRIGLLNVGEEPGKGNELAKSAFALLEPIDGFVGNVEPPAVLAGAVDVVVTDGFTGNIFLKTIEAAWGPGSPHDSTALLLGVAGEVLVAHGAASADDVHRALQRAAHVAQAGLATRVARRMATGEETTS
jgi:phosphate acyltransferase